MNDVRFALRQHFKHSGFFVAAVLMLALGIGATTSLFSAVYGVLIDPYPYAKTGRDLDARPSQRHTKPEDASVSAEEYLEMAKLSAFSDVMATCPGNVLLTGEFAPETISGIRLSGNAFNFLGVPPLIGRTIQPSDIRSTGEPELVTVLSFRRWQRLFGGDPERCSARRFVWMISRTPIHRDHAPSFRLVDLRDWCLAANGDRFPAINEECSRLCVWRRAPRPPSPSNDCMFSIGSSRRPIRPAIRETNLPRR